MLSDVTIALKSAWNAQHHCSSGSPTSLHKAVPSGNRSLLSSLSRHFPSQRWSCAFFRFSFFTHFSINIDFIHVLLPDNAMSDVNAHLLANVSIPCWIFWLPVITTLRSIIWKSSKPELLALAADDAEQNKPPKAPRNLIIAHMPQPAMLTGCFRPYSPQCDVAKRTPDNSILQVVIDKAA